MLQLVPIYLILLQKHLEGNPNWQASVVADTTCRAGVVNLRGEKKSTKTVQETDPCFAGIAKSLF